VFESQRRSNRGFKVCERKREWLSLKLPRALLFSGRRIKKVEEEKKTATKTLNSRIERLIVCFLGTHKNKKREKNTRARRGDANLSSLSLSLSVRAKRSALIKK